ncbi:PLDc N-terminal domain-containing protein [Candidatus Dojkabacteria bacterium]|nr:PLDc N-terminal domain-containing protein [Candidatus Dojkabacteria bacterium]
MDNSAEAIIPLVFCCFYLFAILFGLATFAFWIYILIDAVKREYKNENDKLIWILVLVFGGWIGALVYYFVVKKGN